MRRKRFSPYVLLCYHRLASPPVIKMFDRFTTHQCDNLEIALSEPLPFKLCCRLAEYVHGYPEVFELGDCEYGFSVDSFLHYPLVGRSEVSVWSLTNSFLHILNSCFLGGMNIYRNQKDPSSQKALRPDDVLYYNGAHVLRIESKTETNALKEKELIDMLAPEAHLQFPRGSDQILGLCISVEAVRVYRITYHPGAGAYSINHLESFGLLDLRNKVGLLVFLAKYFRWVVSIREPTVAFHLVPGIRTLTPNGHYVTYTVDASGHACILKQFNPKADIPLAHMATVFQAKLPNVQWGRVKDSDEKTVELARVGFTLKQALRESLISVDVVIQNIRAALDQLHSIGFAHCDVKMDNVFVDREAPYAAFLGDLEFLRPVNDPPPNSIRIPDGCHPRTALELDEAQFTSFCSHVRLF
jgi:hypothetical protein